jgi:hypothetical protein
MRLILLFCFLVVVSNVFAGPPYNTDDPVPVELHHWECNFATQYQHSRGGSSGVAPVLEFNQGGAPNLQLHILVPMAFNSQSGGASQYGLGDAEIGAKYRFMRETSSQPMAAIFPAAEIPTGNAQKGLGNGKAQFFLPVWLQKSSGRWTSDLGGGFWRNPGEGNRDFWFFGWQLQRQMTHRLALGGEVFTTTPNADDASSRTAINLGGTYDFDEGHHLLASVGNDVHGPNHIFMYFGFQWTWGPP